MYILFASMTLIVVFVFSPICLTISEQFSFVVCGIPVISMYLFRLNCSILSILSLIDETSLDKYLFSFEIFSFSIF